MLQPGYERECDRLPGFVAGLGARGYVVQQGVGVRLEPPGLIVGHRRRLFRAGRERPPGPVAKVVEAAVGGDAVQPGSEGAAVEAVKGAPSRQEDLLKYVFGVLERAEDSVAVDEQLAAVGCDQFPEGVSVSGRGPGQGCVGHTVTVPPRNMCLLVKTPTAAQIHRGPSSPPKTIATHNHRYPQPSRPGVVQVLGGSIRTRARRSPRGASHPGVPGPGCADWVYQTWSHPLSLRTPQTLDGWWDG